MIKQINVNEAKILIEQQEALIVDIRDKVSFDNAHIANAVRIDNDNFQSFIDSVDKKRPLIVCCYHGNSSQPATETFNSFGFDGHSLIGGITEWEVSNPVVQS